MEIQIFIRTFNFGSAVGMMTVVLLYLRELLEIIRIT